MLNGRTQPSITEVLALRSRHAQDLRDKWQARLLARTKYQMFAITCAMLAHSYYEAMDVLLRVVFPNFVRLELPLYSGPASIVKTGQVVCNMYERDGRLIHNALVFNSEDDLITAFRHVADELKLSDADRTEMFAAVRRWVVADRRIKPEAEVA